MGLEYGVSGKKVIGLVVMMRMVYLVDVKLIGRVGLKVVEYVYIIFK